MDTRIETAEVNYSTLSPSAITSRILSEYDLVWPSGERFPIRSKMRDITLQVILNLIFGEERAMSVIPPEVVRQFFGRDPSPLLLSAYQDRGILSAPRQARGLVPDGVGDA